MKTEDAGDYGGTCDTCANGVARAGHLQCPTCERREAEVEAHIDEESERMVPTLVEIDAGFARCAALDAEIAALIAEVRKEPR